MTFSLRSINKRKPASENKRIFFCKYLTEKPSLQMTPLSHAKKAVADNPAKITAAKF
jgi:hypothetical protein